MFQVHSPFIFQLNHHKHIVSLFHVYNVNALQATQSHIFVDTLAVIAQNKLFLCFG